MLTTNAADPHSTQPLLTHGPSPEQAAATLLLLHGRGATAQNILSLRDELGIKNLAAIAPQAAGHTWYPQSFLAPLQANQPHLDSALAKIESIIADLIQRKIPTEKILLLGFSQGACLSAEFAARHPRRYGAIMVLTGGLIGPPNTPRNYPGSLANTPIFLGSGDPDPHVPFERVEETATVLADMGAEIDLRRYPGLPHTINEAELTACRQLIQNVIKP